MALLASFSAGGGGASYGTVSREVNMRIGVLLALGLFVGPAMAADVIAPTTTGGVVVDRLTCDGVVCVSPPRDQFGGVVDFRAATGAWGDARSADDFVACDQQIVRLHFWGAYDLEAFDCLSGVPIGDPVSGFNVYFVLDETTGAPPLCTDGTQTSLGTTAASFTGITAFVEEFLECNSDGNQAMHEYCLELPAPVTLTAGEKYWVIIQADNWDSGGSTGTESRRWLWGRNENLGLGCEMSIIADAIGIPGWTPLSGIGALPSDGEFEILTEAIVPIEESTWGQIKSTYGD
jgi:hypothetical protein